MFLHVPAAHGEICRPLLHLHQFTAQPDPVIREVLDGREDLAARAHHIQEVDSADFQGEAVPLEEEGLEAVGAPEVVE